MLFGLPAVAGFAELPLQNHLPGDAGHLAVGHCVGSVPAAQGKRAQFQDPEHMLTRSPTVSALTFGGRIHFAGRAGSVWRRKMKSTSDQNLALEALRRAAVSLGLWFPETACNDLKCIPGW